MRIILFGPPGSGKGTQGDLVEKKYGFPKISTGDLLRQAVRDQSSIGKKAEALMNRGELVSDDIVEELVRQRIESPDCRRGYLLDGFPRNIAQAESLEKIDGGRPEIAIEIEIDIESLIRRLESRRVCSLCGRIYNLDLQVPQDERKCDSCAGPLFRRKDDEPGVIRERMKVYREQTEKIRGYYQNKKVYHGIDGHGGIEDVFKRLKFVLDAALAKSGINKALG
jgi:adenylate kinase